MSNSPRLPTLLPRPQTHMSFCSKICSFLPKCKFSEIFFYIKQIFANSTIFIGTCGRYEKLLVKTCFSEKLTVSLSRNENFMALLPPVQVTSKAEQRKPGTHKLIDTRVFPPVDPNSNSTELQRPEPEGGASGTMQQETTNSEQRRGATQPYPNTTAGAAMGSERNCDPQTQEGCDNATVDENSINVQYRCSLTT